VTVGESLTEARYQAGLSVDELSERTRIRDSVIRSIERDDYEACGGDLYVRGYVRTIAGAVGIDAQPLIQEFDQERVHGVNGANGGVDGSVNGARSYAPFAWAASGPPASDPDATAFDLPPVPAYGTDRSDRDATRFDLPPVREDPSATRFDLPPVRADQTEDMMAAGYELQPTADRADPMPALASASASQDGWGTVPRAEAPGTPGTPGTRRDRRRLLAGVAVVALLAVGVVVGVRLASGTAPTKNAADSTSARAAASSAAARKAAAGGKHTAVAKVAAKPSKPALAPRVRVSQPVTKLPVAAAEAFGPDGLGDGDNASGAYYAIARKAPLPWSTNWYATAQFGLLKHGTGLLLSLGRQVTITSVRIDLASYRGANLQLQVGDGTAPQDFKVAATADNTGGTVRLTFRHPASARYLLIWFTQLPPNGSGQYQESVYHVLVNGRR
jgi:Helix-turn-helix domain